MANLIPEELNTLIQEYLTDGVLTDKERQVILNKAVKMGLDFDEIDLYLDAQVQKIDQQTDAAARKMKGKTCPYCGGSIPILTDKCPHCGENISPEASKELQEIFDTLEEALVDLKSGKDISLSKATIERFARKAKMYYGNNPKIQKLLEEVEDETIAVEKKAKSESRKKLAGKILSNKWFLYLLFVLLVPVLSLIVGYNYINKENVIEKKIEAIQAEIDAKFINAKGVDIGLWRHVELESLKEEYPDDYLKYTNLLSPLESEKKNAFNSGQMWVVLGFAGGGIISLIIGAFLIYGQFFKK